MSRDLPTITVVTPSYNQAEYLEETLRSVLDQGYPNLEYIVLDGGSDDGSAEIIERYADRLAYWRSRPDKGQAAALREGFERATGDILTWLNSDDLLTPQALETVAGAWQRHREEPIVVGACEYFDASGPRRRHLASFQEDFDRVESIPIVRILDLARHWFVGDFFCQPEVFFPRRAYEAIGGVNPNYHYAMDYDLWVRFALHGTPAVVVDQTLARFRKHSEQKTSDRTATRREAVAVANGHLETAPVQGLERERLMTWNRRAANIFVCRTFQMMHRLGMR